MAGVDPLVLKVLPVPLETPVLKELSVSSVLQGSQSPDRPALKVQPELLDRKALKAQLPPLASLAPSDPLALVVSLALKEFGVIPV
jgi:hypothetical protein